jgi:hypothetical protein
MPTIPSIRCKRVKAPGLLLCFISFAPFSVGLDPALIYIQFAWLLAFSMVSMPVEFDTVSNLISGCFRAISRTRSTLR